MDITEYKRRRAARAAQPGPNQRIPCPRCLQPDFGCYCELIQPFDPGIDFIILIHPKEIAKRIATGRMAHLCLQGSRLISGHDFSQNPSVNNLLQDPQRHCVMLYPGPQATNLSQLSTEERAEEWAEQRGKLQPSQQKLTVFVIDGTWATARKTVNVSHNLRQLPRICFTPERPSKFRVRRQPTPECYSTIEAIHQTLALLNPAELKHDHLLHVFGKMVARQLELAHSLTLSPWSALSILED
jgi:DTW domain-containing protein YfiP